ncbi:MAG: sulfur carrier protein ThiS [Spirochaetes bacterium]|nr:sulfur carrier protein ThiS [Spirochaetota bacterium]MBU1081256.1 sulfur carrier protein ThiS [Spirochaetota bacterium]
MTITLNGAPERLETDDATVRGLLKAKAWSFPLIVVTVNGRLVARSAWDSAPVADGDVVEATHLMSGG